MNDTELINLESKVNQLVNALQQANSENRYLRDKLSKTMREKADLLEKNRRAVQKIKQVMMRLRNAA